MYKAFSRIYIQLVFAVKGRASLLSESWDESLYKYTTGIITNKGQKLLAINGAYDHIHILFGMKPTCCLSDLVREIKKAMNDWINNNELTKRTFSWQGGYGAFSYSHSEFGNVIEYIKNQKEHHKKMSFKTEYLALLEEFGEPLNGDYSFDWIEDGE